MIHTVNVNILGISELKLTEMGEFNSDDHYICYCGQESLKKKKWSSHQSQQEILKYSTWMQFKNDRMISVCFQGKPFNITVLQVYALTSNAEETEVL